MFPFLKYQYRVAKNIWTLNVYVKFRLYLKEEVIKLIIEMTCDAGFRGAITPREPSFDITWRL